MDKSARRSANSKSAIWLIPFGIFLIALAVRVIGLKFSFPLLTHHDEQYIMNPLIEMSRRHTLDSGKYNKPNQVLYTLLFGVLNLLSKLVFHKNFGWAYDENPLFFYFYARLSVAFIGALVPVISWKIGKLIKGIDFSIPAAFLTCFYPPFIIHSHYLSSDIINTFFSFAVLMFCLLFLAENKKVWLYLACICAALNTMEKYPGILSYGIIFVTLGIVAFRAKPFDWRGFLRGVLLTLGIVGLSMFLFAPHLFLNLPLVRDSLINEARSTHLGADGLGWAGNMLFYARVFIKAGGWILALFAVVGAVFSILSKQPEWLLFYFGVGYWLALSKLGLHWERWSLPMMLSPLLLAAVGMVKVWESLKSRRAIKFLMIVFSVGFLCVYALNGLTTSIVMSWVDTRVQALQYVTKNGITEENSVSEGYTPFQPRTVKTIFDFDFANPGQIRYVILSSNMYGRFEAEPERYKTENDYYANLRSSAVKIAEFSPSQKPVKPIVQLTVLYDYLSNLFKRTRSSYTTGPTIQIFQLP